MLYTQVYSYTKSQLPQISDIDIKLIISAALNLTWEEVFAKSDIETLSERQLRKLDEFIGRKMKGEPTLLITGYTEFYGYPIKVFPHVLIPRPETEELVSHWAKDIPKFKSPIHLLEIGSGSGCITTAVAMQLIKRQISFKFEVFEISSEAYQSTLYNLSQNLNLTAEKGSFIGNNFEITIHHQAFDPNTNFYADVIIANPPYLTQTEFDHLSDSVKNYEPQTALLGGKDGLEVYKQIATYCAKNEQLPLLYLEIGPEISEQAKHLLQKNYPKVKITKDLFGLKRFLFAE